MTAFTDEWSHKSEYLDALTLQWVYVLTAERYGVNGYSPLAISVFDLTATWTFSRDSERLFTLTRAEGSPHRWVTDTLTNDTPDLHTILSDAAQRASANNSGQGVWFHTDLIAPAPDLMPPMGVQQARVWQDSGVWAGRCRLASWIVLDISPEKEAGNTSPIPGPLHIRARYRVPCPGQGPLAMHLAHVWAEVIRVSCVFAFGRTIPGQPGARECLPEEKTEMEQVFGEESYELLCLFGAPLNLDSLFNLAGFEGLNKVRSSMIAYDAAINQSNADVATILFVTGMEALVLPDIPEIPPRPTTRFVKGISALATPCLGRLINDAAVATAFDVAWKGNPSRRRSTLLSAVYNARSRPAHGRLANVVSWVDSMGSPQAHRVAVLSLLHRHALVGYWMQPRSFLFGLGTGHDVVGTGKCAEGSPAPD